MKKKTTTEEEKNELNEAELDKVSGGVTIKKKPGQPTKQGIIYPA